VTSNYVDYRRDANSTRDVEAKIFDNHRKMPMRDVESLCDSGVKPTLADQTVARAIAVGVKNSHGKYVKSSLQLCNVPGSSSILADKLGSMMNYSLTELPRLVMYDASRFTVDPYDDYDIIHHQNNVFLVWRDGDTQCYQFERYILDNVVSVSSHDR